jgi:Ca2+-binding EF-hand superfamily protein
MREEMLRRFDQDKDGQLSEAERAEARKAGEAMREKFQAMHKEALARFDKDGDGQLNPEERKALGEAWEKFISQQPAAKPAGK